MDLCGDPHRRIFLADLLSERTLYPDRFPTPRQPLEGSAGLVRCHDADLVRLYRVAARHRLALPHAGDRPPGVRTLDWLGVRGTGDGSEQRRCVHGAFPALELLGHPAQPDKYRHLLLRERTGSKFAVHWFYQYFRRILPVFVYYSVYV